MKRIPALFALAVVALLLAWVVWSKGAAGSQPDVAVPASSDEVRAPADLLTPGEAVEREEGNAPAPLPRDAVAIAAPEVADEPTEEGELQLWGTLTRIDEDGTEHTDTEGEIALTPVHEDMREGPYLSAMTPVAAGKWSLTVELQDRDRIIVTSPLFIDQQWCTLEPLPSCTVINRLGTISVPVPDDGALHLRARPLPVLALRVVDAANSSDLSSVDVVSCGSAFSARRWHPSVRVPSASVLHDDVPSPIEVRLPSNKSPMYMGDVWIGSPGYAWQSTPITWTDGGEHRVEMHPGSELEVTTVNLPETSPPLFLRVRNMARSSVSTPVTEVLDAWRERGSMPETWTTSPEELETLYGSSVFRGDPVVDTTLSSGNTTVLRGLPSGTHSLAIEHGEAWKPERLGGTVIELFPHGTSRVEITLGASSEPAPLEALEGTLHVPPAWGDLELAMRLEALDHPELANEQVYVHTFDRVSPGTWAWSAGKKPAGRYLAYLPGSVQAVVETNTPASLALPEPFDVEFVLVSEGGEPVVNIEQGFFSADRPPGSLAGETLPVEFTDGRGSVRAPAGTGALHLHLRTGFR